MKAAPKLPWMKFYIEDQAESALRLCSLAARGLWVEMQCIMHVAEPYGCLVVSGQPVTDAQLAILAGTSPDQVSALRDELENAGVFSRNSKGVIYSRRMIRDLNMSRKAQSNGRKGGNPSLCKSKANQGPVNQGDNQPVKGRDKRRDKPKSKESDLRESTDVDSTPLPPQPGNRAEPARQVAARFIALREELWPSESRLPAPMLTITTEAKHHIDGGGSPELVAELMERGMRDMRAKGKSPPTSLAAFKHSIADGIITHQNAGKDSHEPPAPARHNPAGPGRPQRGDGLRAIARMARGGSPGTADR